MVCESFDPYAVLGVTPTATQAEITHAYRTQVRALHPDTRQNPAPITAAADTQLGRVLAAYAQLREPERYADDNRTVKPTTGQPCRSHCPEAPRTSPCPQGPAPIPVNHLGGHAPTTPGQRPPLWAGPVRQHH